MNTYQKLEKLKSDLESYKSILSKYNDKISVKKVIVDLDTILKWSE